MMVTTKVYFSCKEITQIPLATNSTRVKALHRISFNFCAVKCTLKHLKLYENYMLNNITTKYNHKMFKFNNQMLLTY